MKFFLALLLCMCSLGFSKVVSKQYVVDTVFTSIWKGMGRDAQGNIYIAAGHKIWDYLSEKKDCAFFKFNFEQDRFEKITTVRTVSEKEGNWVPRSDYPSKPFDAAGKVHPSLRELNGKVYFATATTMDAKTYPLELEFYPQFFRGSHLYCYDPVTNVLQDLNAKNKGVFSPGSGIQDIAIDYHHNAIYGVGYPTGKVFRFDLSTGECKEMWQCPDGIPNQDGGRVTRNIIIDNQGILWFANGSKLIAYIAHLEELPNPSVTSVMFPYTENNYSGHLLSLAYSASRDSIYFCRSAMNKIFRFRVKARKIDFIADANTSSLLLRWDLNKLYWIVPEKKKQKLFEYNITSGKTVEIKVEGDGIPKPGHHWSGNGDAIDKFGNLWFSNQGVVGGTALKIDLGVPCPTCGKEPFDFGPKPQKYTHEWPKREEIPTE